MSYARSVCLAALTALVVSGCAGSAQEPQDAHDVASNPVSAMVRWMPQQANAVLFLDQNALAEVGMDSLAAAWGLDGFEAIGGVHAMAVGARIEAFLDDDEEDGPTSVVIALARPIDEDERAFSRHGDTLVQRDGDVYRAILPDGFYAVVPEIWLESVAHVRPLAEGSAAAALVQSMPRGGDPVACGFALVMDEPLAQRLIASAAPDERELMEGLAEKVVSTSVVVQAGPERLTATIGVRFVDPEAASFMRQLFGLFGSAFVEGVLEEMPGLAAHRGVFDEAEVRTENETISVRMQVAGRDAIRAFVEAFDEGPEAAEEAYTIDAPADPYVDLRRAAADHARAGRHEEALALLAPVLEEVVHAMPSSPAIVVVDAVIRSQVALGRAPETRALLERIDARMVSARIPSYFLVQHRSRLAYVLGELGDYEAAARLLESMVSMCDDACGHVLFAQALLFAERGQWPEARALVARYDAEYQPEDERGIAWKENNIAWTLAQSGDARIAHERISPLLARLEAEEPGALWYAPIYNTRALAALNDGRAEEGFLDFMRDVQRRRDRGATRDVDYVESVVWACFGASRAGHHREAIPLCDEGISVGESVLSRDDSRVALARLRRGQALFRSGARREGLAEVRAALAIYERTVLPTHRDRVEAAAFLARPR